MKSNKDFIIPFIGLKIGKHHFDYQIDKKFFDDYEYHDFEDCDIKVDVVLEKKTTMLELTFKQSGTVYVPCDVTGDMFHLPVKNKIKLVVNFGDEFDNENEELLILPHGEHQIDIAQYIYEMIALSVPYKRISPEAKESKEPKKNKKEHTNKNEETDPRWDALKKLLTDK